MRLHLGSLCALAVVLSLGGCSGNDPHESPPPDGGALPDAGLDATPGVDGGAPDGGPPDDSGPDAGDGGAAAEDAGPGDGGTAEDAAPGDAGGLDATAPDAGRDAAATDAGFDAGRDAGFDAGRDAGFDAGHEAGFDAGRDAGGGSCITDPDGTHAVRFEWKGSGSGSTAYVDYELNELPDTSRWHVSSASSSFSYTPTYGDIYLGDGGLILEGSAFIDVELSTAGLSSIRGVTLAIRGRSYDTTTSGSFEWQSFEGTGASPYGSVANSTPYEWYPADATAAFSPGDDGVLLRIYPGPPSGSLVVHRVEICFEAS